MTYGFASSLVDVRDFTTPATVEPEAESEPGKRWEEIVTSANGLIIVTPEYNGSFPGELKILLDKISKVYRLLPVAVCGVSAGGTGGIRVVDHLRHVLVKLGMVPTSSAVQFTKVEELFDAEGKITDERYARRLGKLFDELQDYAQRLRGDR